MTTQNQNNEVTLIGCMASDDEDDESFIFSHEINGEKFFSFTLAVERNSGTKDYLPIIISERLIDRNVTYANRFLCIEGQFRSFNKKSETKTQQALYVFAQRIFTPEELHFDNVAHLIGYLCKKPTYRTTPFGREVSDIMLAVPRLCGKTDYIPCICWGRNALYASSLAVGSKISVSGRVQSREYVKIIDDISEHRTAYEVSVNQINGE